MSKQAYHYCRPVTLRNEKLIDVPSAIIGVTYSYQLTSVESEFVKKAGNNAMAFIMEPHIGNASLLLLCNKETGEILIPNNYSEVTRVEIRQHFIRYMFAACSLIDARVPAKGFPHVLLDD